MRRGTASSRAAVGEDEGSQEMEVRSSDGAEREAGEAGAV